MAQLGKLAGDSARMGKGVRGAAAMRSASLQPIQIQAYMQGQRTVRDDLYTISVITPPMIYAITEFFSDLMVNTAKYLHTPNIDTGATFDSIQRSIVVSMPGGGTSVNVFVTTDYAPFQEFGFVHAGSGQWIYNPFMIPAADLVAPLFVDAITQVAGIIAGRRSLSGPAAASPAGGILQSARSGLYSYSKYAGDIQVLGIGGLSKSRGYALKGAQGIGNLQAAQAGTLASRALRVISGRVGGKFGRSGVVSGFGGGTALTGPSARIYNRVGGRMFGSKLSGLKLPGF